MPGLYSRLLLADDGCRAASGPTPGQSAILGDPGNHLEILYKWFGQTILRMALPVSLKNKVISVARTSICSTAMTTSTRPGVDIR